MAAYDIPTRLYASDGDRQWAVNSNASALYDGPDHPRMKPGIGMAYPEQGKDPVSLGVLLRVSSWSFVSLRG